MVIKPVNDKQKLVELKSSETFNGHLVSCDPWMNLNLREVIRTSADGERFTRMAECFIRGNTIKFFQIPDEAIDFIKEDKGKKRRAYNLSGESVRGRGRGRGSNRS